MPNTVQAAAIFFFLFIPGYLFLLAYRREAEAARQRRDVFVVAETLIFSILLLALAWPAGFADVVRDLRDGEAALNWGTPELYGVVGATLAMPVLLGLIVGGVARAVYGLRWPWLQRILPAARTREWDKAWMCIADLDAPIVQIKTKSGEEIVGVFDAASSVARTDAPGSCDVLLAQEYVFEDGDFRPLGGSVYVDGSDIVSVRYGIPAQHS